jgi:tetratricopeptide (TPR) repeat protein
MRHFRFSLALLALTLSAATVPAQEGGRNPALSQPLPPEPPASETAPSPQPQAAPPAEAVAPVSAPAAASSRDTLFEALKRERDPVKARGIASQVMADMNGSGSATVDLLMQWAATAIKEKRNAAALDFLDQVTVLDPAYPEGWNRRATLHYTMGETRKSMADIAEVLKREPRHIGALAGLAGILTESGKDELAMKAWQRYLDVYPADRDAQEAVAKLSEKLAGNRT